MVLTDTTTLALTVARDPFIPKARIEIDAVIAIFNIDIVRPYESEPGHCEYVHTVTSSYTAL